MGHREDLQDYRHQIDLIDIQVRALLNRRGELAEQVARGKRALGEDLRDSSREAEVLRNVSWENPGPLSDDALQRIFDQMMKEMLQHEEAHVGKGIPASRL